LLDFQAKKNESSVQLDWRTAQEEQLSHFRIERSDDGKVFRALGQKAAIGNSQVEQAYSFVDQQLSSIRSERLYYRLVMVDVDGSEEISPVREIRLPKIQIQVWPNPVQEQLHISAQTAIEQMSVYNAAGQLVYRSKDGVELFQEGESTNQLDTSNWHPGMYQITFIMANGEQWSQRFMKM
jgi:hypothetical protein